MPSKRRQLRALVKSNEYGAMIPHRKLIILAWFGAQSGTILRWNTVCHPLLCLEDESTTSCLKRRRKTSLRSTQTTPTFQNYNHAFDKDAVLLQLHGQSLSNGRTARCPLLVPIIDAICANWKWSRWKSPLSAIRESQSSSSSGHDCGFMLRKAKGSAF